MGILGFKKITVDRRFDRQMGLDPAARGAGARYHRLDGRRRQNRRAQDSDQKSAGPIAERGVSTSGDVYVSIIPFSKNVNLDPRNYTANWIDWTDWEAEPANPENIESRATGTRSGLDRCCPFTNNSYGFQCTTGPASGSSTTSTHPVERQLLPAISARASIAATRFHQDRPLLQRLLRQRADHDHERKYGLLRLVQLQLRIALSNCSCTGSGTSKVCKQTVTTVGDALHAPWLKNDHSTWNGCVTDRGSASGPEPGLRPADDGADHKHQATLFPGRAKLLLFAGRHGPELQLVGHEIAGGRFVSARVPPISRLGWSGAGNHSSAAARSSAPAKASELHLPATSSSFLPTGLTHWTAGMAMARAPAHR